MVLYFSVFPGMISENYFMRGPSASFAMFHASKTVFVGAIHGMLPPENLAKVFSDLLDIVIHAVIFTKKYKYPMGNGYVI